MSPSLALPSVLFVLVNSSAALPAAAARSQEAGGSSVTVDAEPEGLDGPDANERSRTRSRLLHLANGHVLRGPSRATDDGWQVKTGGEWITLPAGQVARVADERDVLAEARKRAAAIERDDAAASVQHGRWLAAEGLYAECLKELDRVLGADPDQADALALVAERPVPVALPPLAGEREPFFIAISRATAAVREMALHDLARVEDRPGLLADLTAELTARTSGRRDFAALALRRLFPGEQAMALVRRAVLDPVSEVRESASRALRDARNPEVAQPVISALGSSHSLVRRNAARALATMNYAAAVEPLVKTLQSSSGYRPAASHIFVGRQIAYIQDFDVEVAQAEAIADPAVNVLTEGAVLDARVLGASSAPSLERSAMYDALGRLTGARVARSAGAWGKWWDEHGANWNAAE
jgi:hypothetical protein